MDDLELRQTRERLEDLRSALTGGKPTLILTHDNPDPDAIASARGLQYLLGKRFGVRSTVAHGGIVGRTENQVMVRLLRMELHPIGSIKHQRYGHIILLDTQPGTGNNSLPKERQPTAVLDHHPPRRATRSVPYQDLRPSYGATSTILTEYLQASGLPMGKQVATALYYGIRTDTLGLSRAGIPADIAAVHYLFPLISLKYLARIQRPRLPETYFVNLGHALGCARIHRDCLVADLGEVEHPDQLSELADAFLRMEGLRWTLITGSVGSRTYYSIRTTRRNGAGALARRLAGPSGSGGGHAQAAAGRSASHEPGEGERSRRRFLEEFLLAVGRAGVPGRSLTPLECPGQDEAPGG